MRDELSKLKDSSTRLSLIVDKNITIRQRVLLNISSSNDLFNLIVCEITSSVGALS